ncbi:MAG TPA: DUF503 domain-containing protein [Bryobacterales bacterium]|nr:DUF503 domain-containing protein [Bryobacterales bacterium]
MLTIGLLTLQLQIEAAHSLKDKRHVVRGLKDRLRNRFNVSVAEVDGQDTWQRSVVAVVTVSGDRQRVEEQLAKVEADAARLLGGDLVSSEVEIL